MEVGRLFRARVCSYFVKQRKSDAERKKAATLVKYVRGVITGFRPANCYKASAVVPTISTCSSRNSTVYNELWINLLGMSKCLHTFVRGSWLVRGKLGLIVNADLRY